MNREIKYRGKRIDNGKWVYGHYFQAYLTDENSGMPPEAGLFFLSGGGTKHCIESNHVVYVIDINTLGEYTGLNDKYNKEIYEHDYVKYHYEMGIYTHQAVGYAEGRFYPLVKVEYGYNAIDSYRPEEFEVIGNKTDNPELSEDWIKDGR